MTMRGIAVRLMEPHRLPLAMEVVPSEGDGGESGVSYLDTGPVPISGGRPLAPRGPRGCRWPRSAEAVIGPGQLGFGALMTMAGLVQLELGRMTLRAATACLQRPHRHSRGIIKLIHRASIFLEHYVF